MDKLTQEEIQTITETAKEEAEIFFDEFGYADEYGDWDVECVQEARSMVDASGDEDKEEAVSQLWHQVFERELAILGGVTGEYWSQEQGKMVSFA